MKKYFLLVILIILIQSSGVLAISASIHIPEEYSLVKSGDRVYFDMDVKFLENKERSDMQFEYQIYSSEGEKIAQVKTVKAIETQISFIDYILIPENAKKGLSTIKVKIYDYEGKVEEEIETTFYITGAEKESINIFYIILLVVTLFVGILVGVDITMHKRNQRI